MKTFSIYFKTSWIYILIIHTQYRSNYLLSRKFLSNLKFFQVKNESLVLSTKNDRQEPIPSDDNISSTSLSISESKFVLIISIDSVGICAGLSRLLGPGLNLSKSASASLAALSSVSGWSDSFWRSQFWKAQPTQVGWTILINNRKETLKIRTKIKKKYFLTILDVIYNAFYH